MKPDRFRWTRSFGSVMGTAGAVLVLFVIFVIAVMEFRKEDTAEEDVVSSIAHILKPDPISQAVIDGAIDTESPEATLRWMATTERMGSARRGEKDGRYYLELKTKLPEVDRELYYYQVWLLRRLPYDFFSLGEMVTDEEGFFVMEWSAPDDQDYSAYSQVIITRNIYGESPEPNVRLVKGEFGN